MEMLSFNVVVTVGSYSYHIKDVYKIWLDGYLTIYTLHDINGQYYMSWQADTVTSMVTTGNEWKWGDLSHFIITSRVTG